MRRPLETGQCISTIVHPASALPAPVVDRSLAIRCVRFVNHHGVDTSTVGGSTRLIGTPLATAPDAALHPVQWGSLAFRSGVH